MQKVTGYDKKKQSFVEKGMKTNDTDNFALDEIYIDIYRYHPYITRQNVFTWMDYHRD